MLQKFDAAKEAFSAILISSSEDTSKEVHAFETELPNKKTEQVSEEDLFEAIPYSCCTNAKNVITSVWRPQH